MPRSVSGGKKRRLVLKGEIECSAEDLAALRREAKRRGRSEQEEIVDLLNSMFRRWAAMRRIKARRAHIKPTTAAEAARFERESRR